MKTMKRIGAIISLAMLIVMLACPFAYAGSLELESMTPKDGQTGWQPVGVAVKMRFNENMTSKEAREANKDCFKITDPKGKAIKYTPVYNAKKYPNDIWLIIDGDLVSNTEYKITVSDELVSSAGNDFGKVMNTTFKIRNMQTDSTINMVMMVGMMGGMFLFTSVDQKRKMRKQAEENIDEEAINPYKLAKEKGISVEEAVKFVEKEKQKAAKKKARAQKAEEEAHNQIQTDALRVSRRRPISAVGGVAPKQVLLRKEAKRNEEARLKAEKLAREKARQEKKKKK